MTLCRIGRGFADQETKALYDALGHHCFCNFQEACNIGTDHQVARLAALDRGVIAGLVDVLHDAVQLLIDLFKAPAHADGVLAHFKAGGGDTAGIGGLARAVEKAVVLDHRDGHPSRPSHSGWRRDGQCRT